MNIGKLLKTSFSKRFKNVIIDPENKLRTLFSEYSLDDLARSFFVLNMWLPNVGSPIKIEYLYTALECCAGSLSKVNKIRSHDDFRQLCESLLANMPSFSMLEDYAPEADWGEIKYFYNEEFYRVFYGASLSNPYDFYSSYEIIHCGFEQEYIKLAGRSPSGELTFCLGIQDLIVGGVDQATSPKPEVIPGHIEIPPEEFWERTNQFLAGFGPQELFDKVQLDHYSNEIASKPDSTWPDHEEFVTRSFEGRNSFYFFIKSEDKYYPVMPRKYLSVLYDTWGELLRKHYAEIRGLNKKSDGVVDIELFKFVRERVETDSVFGLVSAQASDSKPRSLSFAVAIQSKDRLYLIHIVPLSRYLEDVSAYFEELSGLLSEAHECLSKSPTRLLVWSKNEIVEFHHKQKGLPLEPVFLISTPYLVTELRSLAIPEALPGVVLPIDQLLGIIDEVEDADDLANFFDYREQLRSSSTMTPFTSFLDLFGSYKDSHSVLFEGVTTATHLSLDLHWGSEYRFRSLSDFWAKFPPMNFIGHPRGWALPKDGPSNSLKSRRLRAYYYYQSVGEAVFFINAPAHLIMPSVGKVVDLLMQSIRDALGLYSMSISRLSPFAEKNRIQVLCVPSSAVAHSEKLAHLQHLVPDKSPWKVDIAEIGPQEYGITLVFDDKELTDMLIAASDRSIQIDLLVCIIEELSGLMPDDNSKVVVKSLATERKEKNRFRLFAIPKEVSFPDTEQVLLPEVRDFKLADKAIAHLASGLEISPGTYEGTEAIERVNALIESLVNHIEHRVSEYGLDQVIPLLLSNIDSLVHQHEKKVVQVRESIDQEVEYDRESRMGKDKKEFLHDHQTQRYLIEKFVQKRPSGQTDLGADALRCLLALAERLLNLYSASDALYYGVAPARMSISSEYVTSVMYTDDFKRMEIIYSKEQSRMNLGLAGCMDDVPECSTATTGYLEELDQAFTKDMGFGLKDIASVGRVLSCWASSCNVQESESYSATLDQIATACCKHVSDFDSSQTKAICDLLTLRSEDMLRLEDSVDETSDLPVWEYTKRIMRYTIRPIIRIGEGYFWAPYSMFRAVQLWTGIGNSHKVPPSLNAPETKSVIRKAHEDLGSAMEKKCKEIVDRYTARAQANVYPHKLDNASVDIGDFDVIAFFENQGVLITIESKIIDPAFCMKDTRRLRDMIFGREKRDGSLKEGYLHKVEKRHNYLKANVADFIDRLGWGRPTNPPRVVSLFVTQRSYWWTRFPTTTTEVQFVESRLLDDFLRDLISD